MKAFIQKFLKFLVGFAVFFSASIDAKVFIISDLDDTLRKAHVNNKWDAFKKLLRGVGPFGSLVNIYQDLNDHYIQEGEETHFFYVSASYRQIYNGPAWVESQNLPAGEVKQRGIFQGKRYFKESSIKGFLTKNGAESGDTVLFFGDNAEIDEEIYLTVAKELNLQKAKIFIRDILVKELKPNKEKSSQVYYFLSEVNLLSHDVFSVIKESTKTQIISKAFDGELIPPYQLKTLGNSFYYSECLLFEEVDKRDACYTYYLTEAEHLILKNQRDAVSKAL